MSRIANDSLYTGYNKVYFLSKEAEPIDAGVFDMNYGIDRNKYVSGKIFHPELDLFDDSVYNGRMYLKVCFKHHDLSLIGIKAGPGHLHERIFVSTDPLIPVTDVYRQSSNGNILIYGTPIKTKPITLNDDIGQVKLFEFEPFLNKDEMERLINNMNAVFQFKKETVDAKVRAHNSSTEAFLQLSRAVSAESSNVLLGTVVKVLLSRMETYQSKLINMKIDTTNRLTAGMEEIDKNLDIEVPWNDVKDYDSRATIENIRSDINALTAMKNLNSNPSDETKEYAFNLAIEVCGIKFMRQRLGSYHEEESQTKHISTLSGLTTEHIRNQMNAQVPAQEIENTIINLVNKVASRFQNNGNDMTQAVQDVHKELMNRTSDQSVGNNGQPKSNIKQLPSQYS